MTGAITDAVRRRLHDLDTSSDEEAKTKLAEMRRISADAAARWPDDADADPSSWLYDARGLPA